MIVKPWELGDTDRLLIQPHQAHMREIVETLDLTPLAAEGMAWSAVEGDTVLGIGGLSPQWDNRAVAWMLIGCDLKQHFIPLHRAVSKMLIRSPFRRVEATVDVGFRQGHRWMKMLGFEPEGYLRAYLPDGGDQIMYARVRR